MFQVNGIWTAVGVMLTLVALYLILVHGSAAKSVLSALFTGWQGTLSTLQGR
ncbi:MAG: hypothetical protein ACYCVS_11745 [Acidimicrobiales bacterium]